jgi:hypothetical protein
MQLLKKHWALFAVTGMLAPLIQPLAQAQTDTNQQLEVPSRELLEFLLEYGDIDQESFELVVFHGQRDSEIADEQKQNDHETTNESQQVPATKELTDEY